MQKEEFDKMKGLSVVSVRKIRTYRVSAIITLLLLIGVLVATFKWFVLPLRAPALTIAFIGGIFAGVYNLVCEICFSEKHFHWAFKIPEDYEGWKVLYMISKCIEYNIEENILTVQFMDALEPELEKLLYDDIINRTL